jgi:hypothetical protein
MGNKTYKDMTFRISGASTSVLTDITAYINQQDLKATLSLIESTAMGDSKKRYLPGLTGDTVSVNGMVNTTTDGIFGPLISASTSVSKRFEFKAYAARFYNGQIFASDVSYSGRTNQLETFSCNLTIDGALNRTSVALT